MIVSSPEIYKPSETSVRLTYVGSEGAVYWRFYLELSGTSTFYETPNLNTEPGDLVYTFGGLADGTYRGKVIAYDGFTESSSEWSAPVVVNTVVPEMNTPNLAIGGSYNQLVANPNAPGLTLILFRLYQDATIIGESFWNGSQWLNSGTSVPSSWFYISGGNFILDGLGNGFYRVQFQADGYQVSPQSNPIQVIPTTPTPTITKDSRSSLTVGSLTNGIGKNVTLYKDSSFYNNYSVGSSEASYSISNLPAGTYYATAQNNGGTITSGTTGNVTLEGIAQAPTPTAVKLSSNQVQFDSKKSLPYNPDRIEIYKNGSFFNAAYFDGSVWIDESTMLAVSGWLSVVNGFFTLTTSEVGSFKAAFQMLPDYSISPYSNEIGINQATPTPVLSAPSQTSIEVNNLTNGINKSLKLYKDGSLNQTLSLSSSETSKTITGLSNGSYYVTSQDDTFNVSSNSNTITLSGTVAAPSPSLSVSGLRQLVINQNLTGGYNPTQLDLYFNDSPFRSYYKTGSTWYNFDGNTVASEIIVDGSNLKINDVADGSYKATMSQLPEFSTSANSNSVTVSTRTRTPEIITNSSNEIVVTNLDVSGSKLLKLYKFVTGIYAYTGQEVTTTAAIYNFVGLLPGSYKVSSTLEGGYLESILSNASSINESGSSMAPAPVATKVGLDGIDFNFANNVGFSPTFIALLKNDVYYKSANKISGTWYDVDTGEVADWVTEVTTFLQVRVLPDGNYKAYVRNPPAFTDSDWSNQITINTTPAGKAPTPTASVENRTTGVFNSLAGSSGYESYSPTRIEIFKDGTVYKTASKFVSEWFDYANGPLSEWLHVFPNGVFKVYDLPLGSYTVRFNSNTLTQSDPSNSISIDTKTYTPTLTLSGSRNLVVGNLSAATPKVVTLYKRNSITGLFLPFGTANTSDVSYTFENVSDGTYKVTATDNDLTESQLSNQVVVSGTLPLAPTPTATKVDASTASFNPNSSQAVGYVPNRFEMYIGGVLYGVGLKVNNSWVDSATNTTPTWFFETSGIITVGFIGLGIVANLPVGNYSCKFQGPNFDKSAISNEVGFGEAARTPVLEKTSYNSITAKNLPLPSNQAKILNLYKDNLLISGNVNVASGVETYLFQNLSAGVYKLKAKNVNGLFSEYSNEVTLVGASREPVVVTFDSILDGGESSFYGTGISGSTIKAYRFVNGTYTLVKTTTVQTNSAWILNVNEATTYFFTQTEVGKTESTYVGPYVVFNASIFTIEDLVVVKMPNTENLYRINFRAPDYSDYEVILTKGFTLGDVFEQVQNVKIIDDSTDPDSLRKVAFFTIDIVTSTYFVHLRTRNRNSNVYKTYPSAIDFTIPNTRFVEKVLIPSTTGDSGAVTNDLLPVLVRLPSINFRGTVNKDLKSLNVNCYAATTSYELIPDTSSGGNWSINNGIVTFSPNPGFVGMASVMYHKKCGSKVIGYNEITCLVTVPNFECLNDNFEVAKNSVFSGNVSLNDTVPVGTVYQVASNPKHGNLTFNANGTFNYQPTTGFTGLDTFNYKTIIDGRTVKDATLVVLNVKTINVMYTNEPQQATKVKNNCAEGYYSTYEVSYTVPAGEFTAPTQLDANNLALAYANSQAQLKANLEGSCLPENDGLIGNDYYQHIFYSGSCEAHKVPLPVFFTVQKNTFRETTKEMANYKALSLILAQGQTYANSQNKCGENVYIQEVLDELSEMKFKYEACLSGNMILPPSQTEEC